MRYSFFIFFGVILLLDALTHWYLWARLFRDPEWPVNVRRAGAAVIVFLALFLPAGMVVSRFFDRSTSSPLAYAAFTYMGTLLYLIVVLVSIDLARLLGNGASHIWTMFGTRPDLLPSPDRREMMRVAAVGAGTVSVGLASAALRSGLADVEVKDVEVKLERLPKALSGLTLVQLTDVHIGPTIGKRFLDAVVEKTNLARPDAVVITGDLVDGSVASLREHVAPLARLNARYGVYFVTGNHEYYSGAAAWEEELRRMGIKVLRNERVELGDEGAKIDLAGIDDYMSRGMAPGHGPDIERVISGRDKERELVLLAHQPRAISDAVKAGAGLQISGHTHGGQLWPFTGFVALVQPYVAGLSKHDEHTQVYVSRGTGYWGPPMRLLAPAEITKIVLT